MCLEIDLVVFNVVLYKYSDAITRSDRVYAVPTIAAVDFQVGGLSHFKLVS